MNKPILDAIFTRRSIREFTGAPVSSEILHDIIKAGVWAPSGRNNQPCRFVTIQDKEVREEIAQQTTYSHIVSAAQALIAVYLDRESMYDEVKDHQAAGACLQNMLLATEAYGLGSVWLGQILKNKDKVNKILGLSDRYDLMAVLAIGHPLHHNQKSTRKPIAEFLISGEKK